MLVCENISVNKQAYRKLATEIVLREFFVVLFFKCYIWPSGLSSKKAENNYSVEFWYWSAEENLYCWTIKTIQCLNCLETIGLIVAPWKLDILKTSIIICLRSFASRANNYLFQEHQISTGQLSADNFSTETLCCLITAKHYWLRLTSCFIF